jgi:hypothetical protein
VGVVAVEVFTAAVVVEFLGDGHLHKALALLEQAHQVLAITAGIPDTVILLLAVARLAAAVKYQ